MDSQLNTTQVKKKVSAADALRNRLFEKGIGHSSMSTFKSPLSTDYSNRMLLVNLNSSNTSKFSPKVIRKQIAGLPHQPNLINQNKFQRSMRAEERLKTTSYDKLCVKQSQFLQQLSRQTKKASKAQTASNFYHGVKDVDQIQQCTGSQAEVLEFKRTKQLVQKLSGKHRRVPIEQTKLIPTNSIKSDKLEISRQSENNEMNKSKCEQSEIITLQSYIRRALKNEDGLEEFLYLMNSKNQGESQKQEDPYELFVVEYDANREVDEKLDRKYYTVSKKGLCYYVNSKPVEFIELEEWVSEKQNYQKIKSLNFFNRFRKWKTIKMWRKIVLRHSIEECSKNLEERLFFLNPIMRHCLFQIQNINLQLGQNFTILAHNQDNYSLQNFKAVQEKNKRKISNIIQEGSENSRISVRKCFDDNLKILRENMKEKQKEETQQKVPNISSHLNLKDSAFQALGFPPKMSYQNRSRLRKLAGKFIRFAYLVDIIHTAGLALHFKTQLSQFISMLAESQCPTNLEIMMTMEDKNNSNSAQSSSSKLFHVKLALNPTPISAEETIQIPFGENEVDNSPIFNPLYHIKLCQSDEQNNEVVQKRQYCPTICNQWLWMTPRFEDIYKEVATKLKESLDCLKQFERWSKHREIEKFINILEEWDDVVSESREVTQNQNLDPVSIIAGFESSLNQVKAILSKSLETINARVTKQFTEFLNIYWEQQRINLQLFRNPDLQSPAQTIENFLKYITGSMTKIEKQIPYRIRLSAFEINLGDIRSQLLRKAEITFEKFKQLLPEVVEERTKYVNDWLNKYINQICKKPEPESLNIDLFVSKIKYIREAEQTFEKKKQLCLDLTAIQQIMEVYKFSIKKKKDPENDTLKLKEILDSQINSTFEESFKKQAQFYSREVHKNYLPNIVKDISRLSSVLKNSKYISLAAYERNHHDLMREIEQLQKKYEELAQRNTRCGQYQQILNQFHGVEQDEFKSLKQRISKQDQEMMNQIEMPTHLRELLSAKQWIEWLKAMWEMYQKWHNLSKKYSDQAISLVLEDKEKLNQMLTLDGDLIQKKLKAVLGTNQVIEELSKKVQIFSKHLPVILGLNNDLSDTHWEQINELIRKNSCPISLDEKKLVTFLFRDFVASGIGQFKDQLQSIFIKASNEIKLQHRYEEIEKKWKNYVIKTKVEGKFVVIYDQAEHTSAIELADQALSTITDIFSNPYSLRLKLGVLTIQSILGFLETYQRWMDVQKKLLTYDRICRSIDMKKISQANALENSQKQYKAIFKILLPRNIDSSFNIVKLVPANNPSINEKFQECERLLNNLEGSIKNMLQEHRKNAPIYYQLDDHDLLRIIMETNPQQSTSNLASLAEEFICNRFLEGVVKHIKVQGERITAIISIDDENLLKSEYSLSSDLSCTLNQVIEAVNQYTRRTMKACKTKSQQASLYEIVDEFNIQFLLAISKVDFSNYTGISIENRQENSESLRQYWKIMMKDTKNGIRKLKQKKSGNVLGYENLILQNLVHQAILENLVNANIRCANEYEWIKYLRFYWEDNEQSNISIKKMHVNLRYGKEYIGSNSKVLIEGSSGYKNQYQSLDMIMSVIRNSQSYCYLGNYERLRNFTNCIAHRFEKISCNKEMDVKFGNPIKMMLKARIKADCCYFVENAHLLSDQAITDMLIFQHGQNLDINTSREVKLANGQHLTFYNPVFLHFPINQNTQLRINKLQYRSVSLVTPSDEFLVCYLYLIYEVISSHMISQSDIRSNTSHTRSGSRTGKHGKLDIGNQKLMVSPKETVMFTKKIFNWIEELEVTDSNRQLCIQSFLEYAKQRICGLAQTGPTTSNSIDLKVLKLINFQNEPRPSFDLHEIVIEMLLEYIQPLIRHETFIIVMEHVRQVYPLLQNMIQHLSQLPKPQIQVDIVVGYKDCLSNRPISSANTVHQINLAQYSVQQLYGFETRKGLLHKIIYQSEQAPSQIIINGIDQKLVVYLSALIEEHKISQNLHSSTHLQKNTSLKKSASRQKIIEDVNEDSTPFVIQGTKQNQTKPAENTLYQFNAPLSIQIRTYELSQVIDPKLIAQFRISAAVDNFRGGWNYVQQRIQSWILNVCGEYKNQQQKCSIFASTLHKFYRTLMKGLWRQLHKISEPELSSQKSQSTFDSRSVLSQTMINLVRDFLNFMRTLVPAIFSSANQINLQKYRVSFQRTIIYASIYALCHVYRSVINRDIEGIKFENIFDKLQAEGWLCIPEAERIKPSDHEPKKSQYSKKKRYTLFDYVFDGTKLTVLDEYCSKKYPERMIERGEFFLTNEFIHLSLITERAIQDGKSGILLLGGPSSGKSSFCQIYRTQNFQETAHLTIYAHNKSKIQVYSRICKVLSLSDINTIGPKINFSRSLIFIDDLSMPASPETLYDYPQKYSENSTLTQLIYSLSSYIKQKAVVTQVSYQKFKLKNVNFILSLAHGKKNCLIHPELGECTIKYEVGEQQGSIVKIFGQILKANVLDPDIQESTFSHLVKIGFDIYQQICQIADTEFEKGKTSIRNTLNLQILKRMTLFTSHLRFKQNNSSLNELTRFWAYLLKDNFQIHCTNYGIQFNSLQSVCKKQISKQTGKSIYEYLKQPLQQLLYSHLYVKQQVYGNAKQVQYYGQIRKLYNSINQTIHDYNATESKHRYGYYFGLIAIDELINKIVKISNMLLTGDYAIFSRKGSEVSSLIRLVSFVLGFNYKEKSAKKQRIIDIVRETIVELTKVSLFLISVKIDDSNIQQFLEYYECDFEAEVVGPLQAEDLHYIQASGAFDFGISQSDNHCLGEKTSKAILAWQQKNQQKLNPPPVMRQQSSHSQSNSKEQITESKTKFQPTLDQTRFNKLSLRQINKMKRSIRLVFEFQSQKYIRSGIRSNEVSIPQHIISQLNVDFFHEYPRESIIKFSEESLNMNSQGEKLTDDANIMECSNEKFHIMFEIYSKVRTELGLALNQYQECHRLYWYLVGNLSNDIKQNITKYQLIFDLNQKLQEIISDAALAMEQKWQEKINLSARVNKIKESPCQDSLEKNNRLAELTSIETKLSEINVLLQQLTQKRSLCEKMSSFFKPTLPQFKRRYDLLQNLIVNNGEKLKINCLVIASYFTYLSKLPFQCRKSYLEKWYNESVSLSKVQPVQRLTSISEFFALVTEEYMIINKQNEHFYENMMIILNSSRAVLIQDNKKKGRNWIASFDDSFASISESSSDYLQKLQQYLAAGRNIFLEITNQETLNNSLSNQIHNLIFMEENASTVKIGDVEYSVSNKTKVFIVVAPHLTIPQEILNQNLYIIYEQSQSDLIYPLEHQLMLLNNGDKYVQYLEYRKRQQSIMNQCYNLEIPLANVVFDEIYADIDNLDTKQQHPDDDEEIKKLSIDEKKTKEQLMARIEFLSKVGALDKHQERFDRYFTKKKQLEEIRDKINNMELISSYNHIRSGNRKAIGKTPLQKVLNIIKGTYALIEKMKTNLVWLPTRTLYYEVVIQAVKQGLIIINLSEFEISGTINNRYNIGMFVLFVLRQWGQRMNRDMYLILALCLMVIVDVENTTQLGQNSNTYIRLLQQFVCNLPKNQDSQQQMYMSDCCQMTSTSLLTRLSQYMACHSYSIQSLQAFLVQKLQPNVGLQYWEQVASHNNMANTKWVSKANKIDDFIVKMTTLTKGEDDDEGINELLRHIVVLTGKLIPDSNDDEYSNAVDCEMYANYQYRKTILKIIDSECANGSSPAQGIAEIKNTQSFENEIKKIFHDKTAIYLPIIKTPLTPLKLIHKSQSLFSSLLVELASKYPSSQNKADLKSKPNESMTSSQLNNRNKLHPQSSDGIGNHMGHKIHEDFRIYVYHYDIVEVTKLIAETLNINFVDVRERIFIRDISNNLVFNCQISKLLKAKLEVNRPEDQGQSQKNYITNSSHSSQFKNTAFKTKRHIIAEDDKDKQQKNKQTSSVPSMHNLQQETHPINIQIHQNPTNLNPQRTNKIISNQPQIVHHNQPVSRLTQNIHKTAHLILSYIQAVIMMKTGRVDLGNNYYNKYFVSDTYFNSMEKLLQSISADNQLWSFYSTASVICKVVAGLLNSSSNFYFHGHVSKFLMQLSVKLEEASTPKSNPKPSSAISNEDKTKIEVESQKVLEFLSKALDEDLLCMKNAANIHGVMGQGRINTFKVHTQIFCFQSTWLRELREFLELEPKNFDMEIKFAQDSHIGKQQNKQNFHKKTANLKRKNTLVEMNSSKSKSCINSSLKRSSTLKLSMAELQQDGNLQRKPLNEVIEFLFEKDSKVIEIKSNLMRRSIEQSKKIVSHQRVMSPASLRLLPNLFYDLVLLSKGHIPPYISSFVRSSISYEPSLTLTNMSSKLTSLKTQNEKQKKQISNPNIALDMCIYSNPIQMIKGYMAYEFEDRVMRASMQINESVKQIPNQPRKDDGDFYCITFTLTTEELKQSKFIRIKSLWAAGWRLSSESTCEITQQDKVTPLSNVYITKRRYPSQQVTTCQILLLQSQEFSKETIKVYAFTKKTQAQKKVSKLAYLKHPKE